MILLFSDIHASKQAAKDIYALAPSFDALVCAGDVVGYGRDYEYVIDMLTELNVKTVQGNHDRMVLDLDDDLRRLPAIVRDPLMWTRETLAPRYRAFLEALPLSLEFDDLYVTHTVPDDSYVRSESDAFPLLLQTDKSTIVIGHSHVQGLFLFGDRQVVNPGSISKGRRGTQRGYAVFKDGAVHFETLPELP